MYMETYIDDVESVDNAETEDQCRFGNTLMRRGLDRCSSRGWVKESSQNGGREVGIESESDIPICDRVGDASESVGIEIM